ncbi:MAG TPA: hypothetical protein VFC19_17355 [Candidatus Limnocylindrales bacterium]|nr:hypothetical protein [Candidatus Limnocylindrales bacterium]
MATFDGNPVSLCDASCLAMQQMSPLLLGSAADSVSEFTDRYGGGLRLHREVSSSPGSTVYHYPDGPLS